MKKLITLTAVVAAMLINAASLRAAGIEFQEYDQAMKKAAEENKFVMVFFWADWCRYCTQIRKEVFENSKVNEIFDQSFVGVSVDVDRDKLELSKKYRASNSLPTITFVKANGEVFGYFDGAVSKDVFIELLGYVVRDGNGKSADGAAGKAADAGKPADGVGKVTDTGKAAE